eukprot:7381540-Pyramimonas_sp.AAC.1
MSVGYTSPPVIGSHCGNIRPPLARLAMQVRALSVMLEQHEEGEPAEEEVAELMERQAQAKKQGMRGRRGIHTPCI